MAGFTETAFIKKLSEVNNSTQSIQTLSLWLIHHRKHYASAVKIWSKELQKAKEARKLTFMYLANEVIQTSRKKGPEYGEEFGLFLKKAFGHMSSADEKTLNSLERVLDIWKERDIYDKVKITEFRHALLLGKDLEPPLKKSKHDQKEKRNRSPMRDRRISETIELNDGRLETHIHLSPHTPAGDPPEPEELIKAIQDLDKNIASADEAVRQKIAQLPREVTEVSLLCKIEDKDTAEKLSIQVNEAVCLLNEYNNRLAIEMDHRKRVASMMRDFLQVQQELLIQAEQNLEEYQDKLTKVYNVRQELKSHIQNLPDLTQLPDVTGGLAPLPSAEHLFHP